MPFDVPLEAPPEVPPEVLPCVSLLVLLEPMLPEPEPVLPEPVLAPVPLEPDAALDPDLDPWAAFHSSRLIWPSWFLSSFSKDSAPELAPWLELLPPEAALGVELEEGALLLCDMDDEDSLLLPCFAASFA